MPTGLGATLAAWLVTRDFEHLIICFGRNDMRPCNAVGATLHARGTLPTFASRLALLLGLALSTGVAFAEECIVPAAGIVGNVTLRTGPSASSVAVGVLRDSQSLPFVALLRGWYETRLSNGQAAFAAKRSTDIAPCPVLTTPIVGVAAAGVGADDVAYEVHAIDVGTGLSVLVRGPDFSLLYDAGSNDDMARGPNNRTIAYLNTLLPELHKLDHVVLSHPHRDHVELLPDVISEFKPGEVWNSGAYNDICGYRNFLLAIQADPTINYHTATQDAGTETVELTKATCYGVQQAAQRVELRHGARIADEKIILGRGASMTILYADGSRRSSFNENSLVVMLELGSRHVLLMGDAEAGGRKAPSTTPTGSSIEGKLLACCSGDLKADVLVVGHHGSKTSSRVKFLNAVRPTVMVVSAGPTKYGSVVLPDAEIVTELERRGQVFRTDLEDATCATSPDKIGPKEDGKPGGCDNVLVKISAQGIISAEYRRLVD